MVELDEVQSGALGAEDGTLATGAVSITDLTAAQLADEMIRLGVPRFRAQQIFRGVHRRHIRAWSELTELPASLRALLPQYFRMSALELATAQQSTDGTVKLLLHTHDQQAIETVHIPARTGGSKRTVPDPDEARLTVCVSSQAGCVLACRFCATGQMGYGRNLTVGEIVEQIYRAENARGAERQVDNVVFMGMGEPLLNYANVVGAIRQLAATDGYGFSPRRVTVSTSGVVPGMRRLAEEELGVRLAVSLHAPDDELRSQLMPINRRYPLAQVLDAAGAYGERSGRRVSFEYVMLADVNDRVAQATRLARLVHDLHGHVNLIPYNQTFAGYHPSPPEQIRAFAKELHAHGVACTVRASRGRDIAAACGQLKVEAGGAKDSAGIGFFGPRPSE